MYSVGFNDITGDGAESLAKVVLEHTSLNNFCSIPMVSLRQNTITKLDLEGKGVGVPGAIVLSSLMPSATALKSLNLAMNGLDAKAAEHVSEGLKENKALTSLDLQSNNLTNYGQDMAGVIQLSEALKANKTLETLNLGGNELKAEGAEIIAGLLKTNTTLTSVGVKYNNLDDSAQEMLKSAAGDRIKLEL